MLDQAVRLVLCRNTYTADAGIHAIGQHKIDDAELPAKWHGRLGPPIGKLMQTAATSSCQYHGISTFSNTTYKTELRRTPLRHDISLAVTLIRTLHIANSTSIVH